jgi:maltokinase
VPLVDDLATQLAPLLGAFLPRQRWFANEGSPEHVSITSLDVHRTDPLLVWLFVEVRSSLGDVATYQMVLGGRPLDAQPDFMRGKERVTIGVVEDVMFYDALVDPELALDILAVVAPDETADVARPIVVEQSNSSVVYDERLILKLFRRLHPEPNPDVEVNRVLGDMGFPHVVPQRAELQRGGVDLAVVRDFLLGSTDTWQLAQTSLRDLLNSRVAPDQAGGDFGPEAARLGEIIAQLHVALAEAFGTHPAEPEVWLEDMRAQLARTPAGVLDRAQVDEALTGLMKVGDPGVAIRIHGDMHLGQFLQSDAGVFVLDFEGEPGRPVAERVRPTSPLRDVAGMIRSFHYATRAALVERGRDVDPELADLAADWEARAVEAMWLGYSRGTHATALCPADEADRLALLQAFELDKAVYEVSYELAHRPSWVGIPTAAVERVLRRVA